VDRLTRYDWTMYWSTHRCRVPSASLVRLGSGQSPLRLIGWRFCLPVLYQLGLDAQLENFNAKFNGFKHDSESISLSLSFSFFLSIVSLSHFLHLFFSICFPPYSMFVAVFDSTSPKRLLHEILGLYIYTGPLCDNTRSTGSFFFFFFFCGRMREGEREREREGDRERRGKG
jgi:hypothetical protein